MKYYSEKLNKMFDTQKALETAERIYREKETEKVKNESFTEKESKRLAEKEKKAKIKEAHKTREDKLDEKISSIKNELEALLREKENERDAYLSKLVSLQKEYTKIEDENEPTLQALESIIAPFLRIFKLM